MTVSELKYLMAIDKLIACGKEVKLVTVAHELQVSKTSVYNGIERLKNDGYVIHGENGIVLIKKGKEELAEYLLGIEFIKKYFEKNFNIPNKISFDDALGCVCAICESTRKLFVSLAKNEGEKT